MVLQMKLQLKSQSHQSRSADEETIKLTAQLSQVVARPVASTAPNQHIITHICTMQPPTLSRQCHCSSQLLLPAAYRSPLQVRQQLGMTESSATDAAGEISQLQASVERQEILLTRARSDHVRCRLQARCGQVHSCGLPGTLDWQGRDGLHH